MDSDFKKVYLELAMCTISTGQTTIQTQWIQTWGQGSLFQIGV